jgi:hypothetical protein
MYQCFVNQDLHKKSTIDENQSRGTGYHRYIALLALISTDLCTRIKPKQCIYGTMVFPNEQLRAVFPTHE